MSFLKHLPNEQMNGPNVPAENYLSIFAMTHNGKKSTVTKPPSKHRVPNARIF